LGKPAVVRDEEIKVIKKMAEYTDENDISVSQYKVGDSVEIDSGPFLSQKSSRTKVNKYNYVLVLESLGLCFENENKKK
jgi:transcription antitermination factor NusG